MKKRYRLYIDESGDHTYKKLEEQGKRYLGLVGVAFETEYYRNTFQPMLEGFKQKHFPHNPDDPITLHREDIINKRGVFSRLLDKEKEDAFNQDFLYMLKDAQYMLITVVIDKKSHIDRYNAAALHPYHFCLAAILERYCGFLNYYNTEGDVMAESRAAKEDIKLKEAYKEVYNSGTLQRDSSFFQNVLTSKEIKIKQKTANIAGLQLADLIAHPSKNEVLAENGKIEICDGIFGVEICKRISNKYNRRMPDGIVEGYGKKFLG